MATTARVVGLAVLGLAVSIVASMVPVTTSTMIMTEGLRNPGTEENCVCKPGEENCDCHFRSWSYDNCIGQKVCEWNGAKPDCGCKPGEEDCNCHSRSGSYDDCVGQKVCEWNGKKPDCGCKPGEEKCNCVFRSGDYKDCVNQKVCEWNAKIPCEELTSISARVDCDYLQGG